MYVFLEQAAGNAAADAGQALKDGANGDVGADVAGTAKKAVSDVKDAAKSAASKLPGQGSKPVAFYGQGLQVNVGLPNPVEQVPARLGYIHVLKSFFLPPNAVSSLKCRSPQIML